MLDSAFTYVWSNIHIHINLHLLLKVAACMHRRTASNCCVNLGSEESPHAMTGEQALGAMNKGITYTCTIWIFYFYIKNHFKTSLLVRTLEDDQDTQIQRNRNLSVVQSAQRGTCKHFFLHSWCSMAWNPTMAGPGGEGFAVMHVTKKKWIIKGMEKWNPPLPTRASHLSQCTACSPLACSAS